MAMLNNQMVKNWDVVLFVLYVLVMVVNTSTKKPLLLFVMYKICS